MVRVCLAGRGNAIIELIRGTDKRQLAGAIISYMAGPAKVPVTNLKLKAEMEKGASREKLVWGPFKMNAANVSSPALTEY
jgi:hypothetical protein